MKGSRKATRLALAIIAALGVTAVALGAWGDKGRAHAASKPQPDCSGHAAHTLAQHIACFGGPPVSAASTESGSSGSGSSDDDRDTMQLSDEPGNWFRSDRTGESWLVPLLLSEPWELET